MSSKTSAYRLFAARPLWGTLFDIALTIAVLSGSLVLLAHGLGLLPHRGLDPAFAGSGDIDGLALVLVGCSALPLLVWRRFPLGVFAVTAAAGALFAGLDYHSTLVLGPAAALYLLTAGRDRLNPWTWHTTAVVGGLGAAHVGATIAAADGTPGVAALCLTPLTWVVAWFAGERTRLRREQIAELRARAVRAEREAERERLLAATEERARIARDLHDSAGHAISVIAVRAGAARLRHHRDPDRSFQALEAIEELARQTVEEIDQIVGTLRTEGPGDNTEGPGDKTPPGLASLDGLIARHSAAGLRVTLDASGPAPALGGPADQAVYRILQEALTNAARHGAGSAHVELTFDATDVGLTVTNPVRANGARRHSGGHGLIGMRERATLLGGSLDVEPACDAFRVHARIPYGGHRP
ncbi:sensor histidine kinase [Nonomuraea polychroma]|uniref:sensor histidine kinase n=1 Tax=Nonomuraea polychroma TaxID=46176 RepID=UPI0013E2997F|nr:histidine kinase [Nonomuraea polychroma]